MPVAAARNITGGDAGGNDHNPGTAQGKASRSHTQELLSREPLLHANDI